MSCCRNERHLRADIVEALTSLALPLQGDIVLRWRQGAAVDQGFAKRLA